jgi:maltooligosyltrehalose trehalohydrolase
MNPHRWELGGVPALPAGSPRLGAVPLGDQRCSFVVWAPSASEVAVVVEGGKTVALFPAAHGYFAGVAEHCPPGSRYRYLLDGTALADPASRSQPDGVAGPSEVVEPWAFEFGTSDFVAAPLAESVLYELHVGTFTAGGTFDSAIDELDSLVELGVTAVEAMPIAQFYGTRNWGYDGVFPFAAQHSYGGPAAFSRFVDACHRRGLAVVLDVVYNHIGPEGAVLSAFGPYFTDRYATPWGEAVNVDGPTSDPVRRYFIENALSWFRDFGLDGLRLDAIHGIVDPTATPFLAELADATAELAQVLGRPLWLIAESADNNPKVVTARSAGGLGMDAQWNDDFHHALHAVLTGERLGYYGDFGEVDQLARAISQGFCYQGEYSAYRRRRHGAPSVGVEPGRFVIFSLNHDHAGNRPRGERLASLVDAARLRLAAVLVLCSPGVPLLFMGEEYGETSPFPYFVDHADPVLLDRVRRGRAEEMVSYGWDEEPLDATAPSTFDAAVLTRDASDPERAALTSLYRRLLALRRRHPALTRSTRHASTAKTNGGVLTIERHAPAEHLVALCNMTAASVEVSLANERALHRLIDSTDPALGGSGERPVETLSADASAKATICLAGFGFVVYSTKQED